MNKRLSAASFFRTKWGKSVSPIGEVQTEQALGGKVTESRSSALYDGLLCCAAVLFCILIARPFADSGFNDDWSYSHVALRLAETGRLQYNGWGSPMILFQTAWAALWISFFGFSFNLLRIVTIPFALGFVLLTYALGLRTGLKRELALFGALIVGTSPLFLPFAASFMTEAYSCFFFILCLYAAIASAEVSNLATAKRWLWMLAISGIVGGSNRQVVWVAPLALIPYIAWVRRDDRRFITHCVTAFLLTIVCIGALMASLSQPYAPLALSGKQIATLLMEKGWVAVLDLVFAFLTILLISLPALLCLTPFWKRAGAWQLILSGLLSIAATGLFALLFGTKHGIVPFFGNILSRFGILDRGQDALGTKPVVMPLWLRTTWMWLLLFSITAFFRFFNRSRDQMPRLATIVFTIFVCSYLTLLVPGALVGLIYDRYLLLIFPVIVNFILLSFRFRLSVVPPAAWVCLVMFAFYGIATTHDYYSALRARILAAEKLEEDGIPRRHISAGVEYDGWTQLQGAGAIKVVSYGDNLKTDLPNRFWFWSKTTAIDPQFVLTYWPVSDLPAKRRVTIPYRTWLPPFTRNVIVLKREDLPSAPLRLRGSLPPE